MVKKSQAVLHLVGLALVLSSAAAHAKPRVYPGALLTARRHHVASAAATLNSELALKRSFRIKALDRASLLVRDWRDRNTSKNSDRPGLYERRNNLCKLAKLRRITKGSRGSIVCEPDWEIQATRTLPNDPMFSSLYGLDQTNDIDINAPEGWDLTTGSDNVVVAVIDTGINYTHPDLAANAGVNGFYGQDFVNNDSDPADDNGHGTHCSGTIGGVGNNGVGVTGINWRVRLLGYKFLSASGSGSTSAAVSSLSSLLSYYQSTLAPAGKKLVTSNSWGGGGYSSSLYNAISALNSQGVLVIAAAGNDAADNDATPSYPANYNLPNVVSVAAVNSTGVLASFSNYGATTVDIAAPGVSILSTYPSGQYAYMSGTSMATPHVAGLAALLYSYCPQASMTDVRNALFQTRARASLSGKTVTGGEIDAALAMQYLAARCTATATPTRTPTSTPTSTPTPTPTSTPTLAPGETPVEGTPTPVPVASPTPESTPTPEPIPTLAPPAPTATPFGTVALSLPSAVSPGALFQMRVTAPKGAGMYVQFSYDGQSCPSTIAIPATTRDGGKGSGIFLVGRNARYFDHLTATVTARASSGSVSAAKSSVVRGRRLRGRGTSAELRAACPRLVFSPGQESRRR